MLTHHTKAFRAEQQFEVDLLTFLHNCHTLLDDPRCRVCSYEELTDIENLMDSFAVKFPCSALASFKVRKIDPPFCWCWYPTFADDIQDLKARLERLQGNPNYGNFKSFLYGNHGTKHDSK